MGISYSNERERCELNRRKEEELKARNDAKVAIANKIAMVVTDKICNDLIRPGPHPEERECYEVAQELRDMNAELVTLIVSVLDAEKEP
jgi:hypothetical protein